MSGFTYQLEWCLLQMNRRSRGNSTSIQTQHLVTAASVADPTQPRQLHGITDTSTTEVMERRRPFASALYYCKLRWQFGLFIHRFLRARIEKTGTVGRQKFLQKFERFYSNKINYRERKASHLKTGVIAKAGIEMQHSSAAESVTQPIKLNDAANKCHTNNRNGNDGKSRDCWRLRRSV